MEKKTITEEMKVHDEWYERARATEYKDLQSFIDELVNGYKHDYGTICHALAAGAVATVTAMNRTESGGITGFQASFVMWGFIKNFMRMTGALRLVRYEDMLYPQYQSDFEKIIRNDIWEYLQEEAKKNLEKDQGSVAQSVVAHWQSIVDGIVPFGYTITD